jgi:hypothetical protein
MWKWWRSREGYCTVCAFLAIAAFVYMAFSINPRFPPAAYINNTPANQAGNTKRSNEYNGGHNTKSIWQALISPRDPLVFLNLCLVGVTGILAASTIGLWIVTAHAGKRQSEDMRRSINAATAAERRQLRAYVGVEKIWFDLPHMSYLNWKAPRPVPPGYFYEDKALVEIKNFGGTPAYEVGVTINWQIMRYGLILPIGYTLPQYAEERSPSSSQVIDVGKTFTATINIRDLLVFQEADARVSSLYIYGHILYTDVYGRRWRRGYRYMYEPWRREGERFWPHHEGNDETYEGERSPKLPA